MKIDINNILYSIYCCKSRKMSESKKGVNDSHRLIGDSSLRIDDLLLVSDAEVSEKGLVNHHLESMNDLYQNGVHQIITQVFKVEQDIANRRTNTPEDLEIDKIHVEVKFTDVFLSRPTMVNYFSGKEEVLYPKVALLEDKTYSANLRVNASIKATAYLKNGSTKVKEDEIKNFKICRMPIMVRSVMCNTYGCSKEALINLKEDPTDPGGYFIIKGVEWVIDCIENILFNQIRIFKNDYNKEVIRAEFISKPGDSYQNMGYLVVRWLTDGQITVEIVRDKMRGIYVPFYLIFRLMGWATDKEIFDNITYGAEGDAISRNMNNYLRAGFAAKYPIMMEGRNKYKQSDVLKVVADELKRDSLKYLDLDVKPEAYKQAFRIIHREFDTNLLPHVGHTPDTRHRKMKFMALIIRRMFLVKMGNLQPTDRDSYMSKRIHAAGQSYAKPMKTYFNASIVQQIKRRLVKDFKNMSFSQINLAATVRSSVYGADFERLITQAITSGNRTQLTVNVRRKVTNRLSSQLLNRHNQLSVFSTLRQVTTTSSDNSKQSERASEMRRVHMTFLGYICCAHSPEGEKTGINKQMAISASVCKASSSEVVKDMLRNDSDIIADTAVHPEMIGAMKLCNIYVNGDWVGFTKDTIALVTKYRNMRRNLQIDPYLTIHWENTQDEVYFWSDVGRMMRPLMIVYNTKRDPAEFSDVEQKGAFRQGVALTNEHIKKLYQKNITMSDLLKERVVEYISPEEQENYFICAHLDLLNEDKNNELNEYTHCDISQNILGLTALTSPYAHHNAVPRLAYQTSQAKQTCGLFALNWPYRCDKDTFLQYNNETPIIRTMANMYTFPNGANVICAIMCNTGYNQEDSLVWSQGAFDRGLFNGSKFTYYRTELEQKEEFGNPDAATTTDIKSASYEKLHDGIIKVGAHVEKGDAIIGKFVRLSKSDSDKFLYSDRSIIYKDDEPAIVHAVIVDRNEDDERFCKVALRKLRPVVAGDKFCVPESHEVLTSAGWKKIGEVTVEDRVYTLNQETNEIEMQNPTQTYVFDHVGEMYQVESRGVDLITTLDHKMYVRYGNSRYSLKPARDVYRKSVNYKKDGKNTFEEQDTFAIPEYTHVYSNRNQTKVFEALDLDMDSWLEFFGIYLAEGWIDSGNMIRVAIHKPRVKTKILEMMENLDFTYNIYPGEPNYLYITKLRQVSKYLKQFGKSYNKFLPDWCFTLSRRQSLLLLNGMLLGDGYQDLKKGGSWEYYTGSKKLADGVQILALMSGQSAQIKIKNLANEIVVIKGQSKVRATNQYRVYISDYKPTLEPLVGGEKTSESLIDFDGKVYCIEVPNHIFMIRYNNKYVWTGNSSRSGQLARVDWQQSASVYIIVNAKQLNCGDVAKVIDTARRGKPRVSTRCNGRGMVKTL